MKKLTNLTGDQQYRLLQALIMLIDKFISFLFILAIVIIIVGIFLTLQKYYHAIL